MGGGVRKQPQRTAQHAVKRYVSALEVIPRTLAKNALGGAEGNEVLSRLWAKHEQKGGESWGVDIEVRSHFLLLARRLANRPTIL